MALEQPWVIVLVAGCALLAIAVGLLLAVRWRRGGTGPTVARAERVRALPSVARAVGRRTVALVGILALAGIATAAAAIVAARPMQVKIVQPETHSRDIMLCLDVSGSMSDVDVEVLELFAELADDFEGERVGLTIFNSSPVRVFPLTDDYAFVRDNLASVRESFEYVDEIPEHWVGTLNGTGGSLVGDGLAACALGFDHPDLDRARSIILATDNEVYGTETIALEEAASYAGSLGVRLFAIDPADSSTENAAELRRAAEGTGGSYFGLHDATTVDTIVAEVQREDATLLKGQPRIVRVDAPGPWVVVLAVVALALVLVGWRVRE